MKLILTSKDFLNEKVRQIIVNNIEDISKCKILFIPPGDANVEDYNSKKYLKRIIEYGFVKENIYILNYYNINQSLNLNIDVIYVGGGNTFRLLNRLRKCGFDKEIVNYVHKNVTYIGGSAGTHIVTKNIQHVLDFDKNDVNIKDFTGLDLFNGIVF